MGGGADVGDSAPWPGSTKRNRGVIERGYENGRKPKQAWQFTPAIKLDVGGRG